MVDQVALQCPTCGGNLSMTAKGLTCPHCDTPRKVVVRRCIFGFRVQSAENIVLPVPFLTRLQCAELLKGGVQILLLIS